VLLEKLGRVIRCKPTLELCRRIVAPGAEPAPHAVWFPGDDLFAALRPRGLPIGNLTSQLWANFYLDRIDHLVLEALRAPGYARYTDDFLIWSDDKAFLQQCRASLGSELAAERLVLHPVKPRVLPTRTGVPFLGFRFVSGVAPRVLGECKRRFERRMRRKVKALRGGALRADEVRRSAEGWKAFADYGNTHGLYLRYRHGGFG